METRFLPTAQTQNEKTDTMRALFGPLTEQTYQKYAPSPPNDPDYAIDRIKNSFQEGPTFRGTEAVNARAEMWSRYAELIKRISTPSDTPIMQRMYGAVCELSPLAAQQMGPPKTNLMLHLAEVSDFSRSFLQAENGASRFPSLLTNREAALTTEIIAPLHDLLKQLGTHAAQIVPDHEILTAELVSRTFVAQKAILLGKETTLTKEDVRFIASVIGDHENLDKEHGRDGYIFSDKSADRAKALFCVLDTLTGVIVPDTSTPSAGWKMDPTRLESRFTDLCFRHIDLVKGKTFRPEWGASMIKDLCAVLDHLTSKLQCPIAGTTTDKTPRDSLIEAGRTAIDRARESNRTRSDGPRFTPEQIARIDAAYDGLRSSS